MFRSITIRSRILFLLGIMLSCLVLVSVLLVGTMNNIGEFSIAETQKTMLAGEKAKIKVATHTIAVSLGDILADLPESSWQPKIQKAIAHVWFEKDKSGYYFVYHDTTVAAHAAKPSL